MTDFQDRLQQTLPIPMPDTLVRHEVTGNGCTVVVYHRPGTRQEHKHHVLFYHGACGRSGMWREQFDQFPEYDLYFVDVRGQGESVMTEALPDFNGAIEDIPAILDFFGIDDATLVGHSWGGNPLQEYTLRSPQRVRGLAIIGTWGQHRVMSWGERFSLMITPRLYRVIPWSTMAKFSSRACSSVPETQRLIAREILNAGRDVFLSLGNSAYKEVHPIDGYPGNPPMLLMRGSDDFPRALSGIYSYLESKNPNAEQVVIPDTAHQPMMDAPDLFNEELGTFLNRVDQQPRPSTWTSG